MNPIKNTEIPKVVNIGDLEAQMPTAEEMQEDREERNNARALDLTRTKDEVEADTERMIAAMKPKQKRVYERLSKFVFRKHCKRTLYVAITPNRSAQISLAANVRYDSGEYIVADVLNILAAAALGSASVFMRYQRVGYVMDGLSGFIADRGRAEAIPTKQLQLAWNAFLKDGTFVCNEPVFFTQSVF